MSRKKKTKKRNSTEINRSAKAGGWFTKFDSNENVIPLTDYASYVPGILMVSMIALILVLDLFTTLMADSQYYDFHNVFRAFDYVSIASGVIFLIHAGVKKQLTVSVRDGLFAAFMVCILISTIINGFNHDALFGMPIRYIGILNMFAFFIVYMKVSGMISRVSFRYRILTGYILVADALALSAVYEQFIGNIPAYQEKIGLSTLFANSNHYGYFLCMAVMIGIGYFVYEQGWKSYTGAASALLNLFVLVLNNTLGAELAVGICTILMTLVILICDRDEKARTRKTVGMIVFFAVCVCGAFIVSAGLRATISGLITDVSHILSGHSTGMEGSGRLVLWETTVKYIADKPLFGYGCEGITRMLLESCEMGDAHCEPLTYAAYYGIPAALLYLGGIIAAAVSYFRNRAELPPYCRIAFLAAGAYFISSLVGVPMFYTAPFFFIFMGLATEEYKDLYGTCRRQKKDLR